MFDLGHWNRRSCSHNNSMNRMNFLGFLVALGWITACAGLPEVSLAQSSPIHSPTNAPPTSASGVEARRLVVLGPGDQINLEVYGQPDMTSTLYVGDDGSISVPLAGAVPVSGVTPVVAAKRVEEALIGGQYLKSPHVTIALLVGKSQRVTVLGEVHTPGRYPIEPNTSIFDLLALAGGTTQDGADTVDVLRTGADSKVNHFVIDLKALGNGSAQASEQRLQSGDQIIVPRAEQFYIYGEVARPDKYRIERGMTVVEAIARAGGITPRGSDKRVEIKRMGDGGKYTIRRATPSDLVQSNDVIRVKESIF
jgi:polysaccharide biosynthesis/export protein